MGLFRLLALGILMSLCFPPLMAQQPQEEEKKAADYTDVRYAPAREDLPSGEESSDRMLDIFLPRTERPAKGYPAIVFIHGGGFTGGDKGINESTEGICNALLGNGFAFVSINYYLTLRHANPGQQPEHRKEGKFFSDAVYRSLEDASTDAVLALEFLEHHAREYGLDMDRLAIMGGSAGAMTCLYTAFGKAPSRPRIRAVVNCWGAIDDVGKIATRNLPVLTIHGTDDTLVPYEYGLALQNRMEQIGSTASRMITMKGRGHAQYRYVGENLMGDVVSFLKKVLE